MTERELPAAEAVIAEEGFALARAISLIERNAPGAQEILERARSLSSPRPPARRVLVTGPAGAGKSSTLRELARGVRARGARVAILACDPASERSRGALLGDRVRFPELNEDEAVFVRSIAAREPNRLVNPAVWSIADLLDACRYEWIFVETVGAGQNARDESPPGVIRLLVLAPGQGDEVQFLKAGLLEWADIIVVNKADVPGADTWARLVRETLEVTGEDAPAVLLASAATGEGIDAVIEALESLLPSSSK
ncbi:MAG TPA: AAA family ATPase [Planctomycetota bacterium]|nr:AAA family ATPase [Planctomycetota bacterium]